MKRSFFGFSRVPQSDSQATSAADVQKDTSRSTELSSFKASLPTPLGRVATVTTIEQESVLCTPSESKESFPSLGKPSRKRMINVVDALATLLCILCLIGSIIVVHPSLPYAAQLAYTRQLIAVGFFLGVMTQCMLRTVPYAFLLIEARYGRSTLQNFDGLLRWTPLANHLGVVWRILLILLLLLPLGLSIGYKRYTGGVGYGHVNITQVALGPSALPGTQGIGTSTTVTNATAPFVAATVMTDSLAEFGSSPSPVYGYNLVLLSETKAAALDTPLPENVT